MFALLLTTCLKGGDEEAPKDDEIPATQPRDAKKRKPKTQPKKNENAETEQPKAKSAAKSRGKKSEKPEPKVKAAAGSRSSAAKTKVKKADMKKKAKKPKRGEEEEEEEDYQEEPLEEEQPEEDEEIEGPMPTEEGEVTRKRKEPLQPAAEVYEAMGPKKTRSSKPNLLEEPTQPATEEELIAALGLEDLELATEGEATDAEGVKPEVEKPMESKQPEVEKPKESKRPEVEKPKEGKPEDTEGKPEDEKKPEAEVLDQRQESQGAMEGSQATVAWSLGLIMSSNQTINPAFKL